MCASCIGQYSRRSNAARGKDFCFRQFEVDSLSRLSDLAYQHALYLGDGDKGVIYARGPNDALWKADHDGLVIVRLAIRKDRHPIRLQANHQHEIHATVVM